MGAEEGFEGALAAIQQTRADIRGTKDWDILTDRRPTREDMDVPRSPTTRLIRGSLAHALDFLRHDPIYKEDKGAVDGFRAEVDRLAQAADRLDVQFHKNGREIETQVDGNVQPIYVAELDLNPPKEGEVDERIPWLMIGGALSTSEQNAGLSMALALQGERVMVATHPGQMGEQSGGRGFFERIGNSGKKDLKVFSQVVEKLGSSKLNLIGHSLGGRYVLEIAGINPNVEIHDVVALAPTGFEGRSLKGVGEGFAAEDKISKVDPEQFVGMASQGNEDAYRKSGIDLVGSLKDKAIGMLSFLGSGRAAASQAIASELIADKVLPNISGDLEIWTADGDGIVNPDAIENVVGEVIRRHSESTSRLSSYVVEGAGHNIFFINGLGFVRARDEEQQARHEALVSSPQVGKRIGADALERSAAEFLLKKTIKAEASAT